MAEYLDVEMLVGMFAGSVTTSAKVQGLSISAWTLCKVGDEYRLMGAVTAADTRKFLALNPQANVDQIALPADEIWFGVFEYCPATATVTLVHVVEGLVKKDFMQRVRDHKHNHPLTRIEILNLGLWAQRFPEPEFAQPSGEDSINFSMFAGDPVWKAIIADVA